MVTGFQVECIEIRMELSILYMMQLYQSYGIAAGMCIHAIHLMGFATLMYTASPFGLVRESDIPDQPEKKTCARKNK